MGVKGSRELVDGGTVIVTTFGDVDVDTVHKGSFVAFDSFTSEGEGREGGRSTDLGTKVGSARLASCSIWRRSSFLATSFLSRIAVLSFVSNNDTFSKVTVVSMRSASALMRRACSLISSALDDAALDGSLNVVVVAVVVVVVVVVGSSSTSSLDDENHLVVNDDDETRARCADDAVARGGAGTVTTREEEDGKGVVERGR